MGDTGGNEIRLEAETIYHLRKMFEQDAQRINEKLRELRQWCTHRREDGSSAFTSDDGGLCFACGTEQL
jgi:hypothetical protein